MIAKARKLLAYLQVCTLCALVSACGATGGNSSAGAGCMSTMEGTMAMLTRGSACIFVSGSGCGGPSEHQADLAQKVQALTAQGWQSVAIDWNNDLSQCQNGDSLVSK